MKKQNNANARHRLEIEKRIRSFVLRSPWVLRITEHKDKPVPVLIIKERLLVENSVPDGKTGKRILKDRGLLYGRPLRRSLPVLRSMVGGIYDDAGIPLDLPRLLTGDRISFRGNLPLNKEAGYKLALFFRLRERLNDMDRVELIAWRIDRFTREEAGYWLSRVTQYGSAANRWAQSGLRILLGGQPGDKEVMRMLEELRR